MSVFLSCLSSEGLSLCFLCCSILIGYSLVNSSQCWLVLHNNNFHQWLYCLCELACAWPYMVFTSALTSGHLSVQNFLTSIQPCCLTSCHHYVFIWNSFAVVPYPYYNHFFLFHLLVHNLIDCSPTSTVLFGSLTAHSFPDQSRSRIYSPSSPP